MSLQQTCSKVALIDESTSLQYPGSSVMKALEMVEEVGLKQNHVQSTKNLGGHKSPLSSFFERKSSYAQQPNE